jgi:Fe-S oxidoreductase
MKKVLITNVTENLADVKNTREKCIRCSMCKFPPLAVVENSEHSMGCPSYEEFLFHSNSGGGLVAMANSLDRGRSEITDSVKETVYGCTLCGLCDVSCKYGAAVEVFDTLLALRKKVFDEGVVYPEHQQIIDSIKNNNHPLISHVSDNHQAMKLSSDDSADTLLWVGSHFARDTRLQGWFLDIIKLLKAANISFKLLFDDEPDTGRAALEIGDVELFKRQSQKVSDAIKLTGANQVLCLSAEDYSTLRSQTPKYAPLDVPIKHITEIYDSIIKGGKLTVSKVDDFKDVAWHDPCYLGRLGGKFEYWEGVETKINQMPVYVPDKPINYGTGGVFDAPRNIIDSLILSTRKEFSRRKEYAFNAGESGQAIAVMPEFAKATARRRLQEADDLGIRTVVTECPKAYLSLQAVIHEFSDIQLISLTQLIMQSNY